MFFFKTMAEYAHKKIMLEFVSSHRGKKNHMSTKYVELLEITQLCR